MAWSGNRPSLCPLREQKAKLIDQIKKAATTARIQGVGYPAGAPETARTTFTDACNGIKKTIREQL
jgi:hypothetical protein